MDRYRMRVCNERTFVGGIFEVRAVYVVYNILTFLAVVDTVLGLC